MRQAITLRFTPEMILPRVEVETLPTIGVPVRSMQLRRFGEKLEDVWRLLRKLHLKHIKP